ncbi:MAG: hypothetical protein JEZ03_06690 [Bacteroidales bacterium]|nr:hypothetical protein [Bacteroidales bacterium]
MKKINVLFAILTVILVSTIAMASAPENERPVPCGVHVHIVGNNNVLECGDMVTLTFYSSFYQDIITVEQEYTGAKTYHWNLPHDYSGFISANLIHSCDNGVVIMQPMGNNLAIDNQINMYINASIDTNPTK